MANVGKFIDRFPEIKTAGIIFPVDTEGVFECLTFPSNADNAEIISKSAPFQSAHYAPLSDINYRHYNTRVKDIIEGDIPKGFDAFRAELRETAYKSYWRDEVGKIPDQVPNLPIGMDPENTTFGSKPTSRITCAEVLNPNKSSAQLEHEHKIVHHLYCKSHNSYDPGEQKRVFDPPLPSNIIFGTRSATDMTGTRVKSLLEWSDQSVNIMTSKSLRRRTYYPLGKSKIRSGITGVSNDTVFGKPSHHGMKRVNKSSEKVLPILLSYLFKVKEKTKKKMIDLRLLKTLFKGSDTENTSYLPSETVYSIISQKGICLDRRLMNQILTLLSYQNENGDIFYNGILDLMNIKIPLPDVGKVSNADDNDYRTMYMQHCADLERKAEYDKIPMAGSPNVRADLPSIRLPFGPGWCRAHLEDIPMQTTVDDVLRPNIYTHYGLSIYDVFKPRSKDYIKNLFIKQVGLNIPENVFEIIWEEGLRRDGVVSVETFKNILGEISTAKLEEMADTSIQNKPNP